VDICGGSDSENCLTGTPGDNTVSGFDFDFDFDICIEAEAGSEGGYGAESAGDIGWNVVS
jgi:hypothetical protein